MKRYSILWWSIILPTSVIAGVPAFFLVGHFSDLDVLERFAAASVATFVADLAIAASMEAVAPTKVNIGPGEKVLKSETPAEEATIIFGFDSSPHGRVSVRGETWLATRLPNESSVLSVGMAVRVVSRNGLSLVVTAKPH
ncbi:MAG: NfeD family protein [Woeseiaceae bacterium]|jgi:membrane protein implicated in regulation of membrane protease activity